MSDSIEHIIPLPRAGSSPIGKPPAVASDEQATVYQFPRVSAAERILERRPVNLVERLAANDRELREHEKRAMGGRIGFGICVFVCVFVGFLLATGGSL